MGLFTKKTAVAVIETAKPAAPAASALDWRALAGPDALARLDAANAAAVVAREKLRRLRGEVEGTRAQLETLVAERDSAVEAAGRAALCRVNGDAAPAHEGRPLGTIAAELAETEAVLAVLEKSPVRREILAESAMAEAEAEHALNSMIRAVSDAATAALVEDMGPRLAATFALARRAAGLGGLDFQRWATAVFGALIVTTARCPDDLPLASERVGLSGDEQRELERHGAPAGLAEGAEI